MKREVHVVGGAICRDDHILVARRSVTMAHPGLWEFPGGKVERGEAAEDALARELEEELALAVQVGPLIGTSRFETAERVLRLDVYWCTCDPNATFTLTEHAEARWVTAAELLPLEWAPPDVPIVAIIAAERLS